MKTRLGRISRSAFVAMVVMAAFQGRGTDLDAVPAFGYDVWSVTNALSVAHPVIDGTLHKTGAGALTVTNLPAANGTVVVETGSLSIAESGETPSTQAPTAADSAFLWMEATAGSIDTNETGQVTEWRDRRETAGATVFTYPRAVRHGDEDAPRFVSTNSSVYLDFGDLKNQEGAWLKWVDNAGARQAPRIYQAFAVYEAPLHFGTIFGDSAWDGSDTDLLSVAFRSRSSPTAALKNELILDIVQGAPAGGRTWLDGRIVNPVRTIPLHTDGRHVLSFAPHPSLTVRASNFFRECDRTVGGGRLYEVLVFTNVLDEVSRSAVESYLLAKWRTRAPRLQGVDVQAGGAATVSVSAGGTLEVSELTATGPLRKTGDGTLATRGGLSAFGRGLELAAGAVDFGTDFENQSCPAGLFAVTEGGQTLTADGAQVKRTTAAAGTFCKAGEGTLAISRIPEEAKTLKVDAGTLRLMPVVTSRVVGVSVPVTNASFETCSWSGTSGYNAGATFDGWTGQLGATSSGKWGVTATNSPWVVQGVASVPDGVRALFIQDDARLSTTVELPAPGRYRLSFSAFGRADGSRYRKHVFHLSLGGVRIADVRTLSPYPARFVYETPVLPAGAAVLEFAGVLQSRTNNLSSVIDDLHLELTEPSMELEVAVTNGSFETSALFDGSHVNAEDSGQMVNYLFSPAEAGWEFTNLSGETDSTDAGIAYLWERNNRSESLTIGREFGVNGTAPDGRRYAFIRRGGLVRQTVTLPETGWYRVSCAAARRVASANGALLVTLGTTTNQFQVTEFSFQPFSTLVYASAGPAVLSFVSEEDSLADILLDDVRVTRVTAGVACDGGFESALSEIQTSGDDAASWIRVSNETRIIGGWTWASTNDAPCGPATAAKFGMNLEGSVCAFLQYQAELYRTVTIPKKGAYQLTFKSAGRPGYTGHRVKVSVGGRELGVIRDGTTSWTPRRFLFTAPTDNAELEIRFSGLPGRWENHSDFIASNSSTMIDDVQIASADAYVCRDTALIPRWTAVEVAQDAWIDLAFGGTVNIGSVKLGGKSVHGEINATTHPGYVKGSGSLFVVSPGTKIVLR